jgi:hypothetical protein
MNVVHEKIHSPLLISPAFSARRAIVSKIRLMLSIGMEEVEQVKTIAFSHRRNFFHISKRRQRVPGVFTSYQLESRN